MNGNIVFARSRTGIVPTFMAWFMGSPWSHCFIKYPDYIGREMALEVSSNGVDFLDFNIGYRDNTDQSYEMYSFAADETLKLNALAAILTLLEDDYAYLALFWFVWRYILKLFGINIQAHNNWYQTLMICSGLDRKFLDLCNRQDLTAAYGLGSLSTQDLYEIVLANPQTFTLVEKKNTAGVITTF